MKIRSFAACLMAMAVSASAVAGDLNPPAGAVAETGRFGPRTEINAANTPGDLNSLFKISQPGSYYLGGNIIGLVSEHGIELAADGITIDLMGFELRGVAGSLNGIHSALILRNVTIRNGVIRDWGGHGVGLDVVRYSTLRHIAAYSNVGDGLRMGSGCMVQACTSSDNGGSGIVTSSQSTIFENNTSVNTLNGIAALNGCSIIGNVTTVNTQHGISTGEGCLISDNTTSLNKSDGIKCASDCLVINNSCDSNGAAGGDGAGIHVIGSDSRIDSNHVTDSDRGIDVDTSGNLIIRNSVSGSGVYYDIVANNKVGVIVIAPSSPAIIGLTGGVGVGTTDPWANFSY